MKTRTKTVLCDEWGRWYAEVYEDDDASSGYGDDPRVGRWYGTREECETIDPEAVELRPLAAGPDVDAFDVACERRYDG